MAIQHGITKAQIDYLINMPEQVRSIKDASNLMNEWRRSRNQVKRGSRQHKILSRKIGKARSIGRLYGGAIGELKTVNVLKQLPKQYHIVCGVESNDVGNPKVGDQVDVAVVGPGGIYAIEVKNLTKPTMSDDAHRQADEAAYRLGQKLGIKVDPILIDIHGTIGKRDNYPNVKVADLQTINNIIKESAKCYCNDMIAKYSAKLKSKIKIPEKIRQRLLTV